MTEFLFYIGGMVVAVMLISIPFGHTGPSTTQEQREEFMRKEREQDLLEKWSRK